MRNGGPAGTDLIDWLEAEKNFSTSSVKHFAKGELHGEMFALRGG